VGDRVLEGEQRDPCGGPLGDDLQRLDHPGNDDVLEPAVEVLGVLTHHHHVHVLVA